jgi:tRNA(Ile)-lysidine synthase
MQNDLELRVRKTIQRFGMISGDEHILVAVSGGPDSVALLLCLRDLAPALNLTLTVAHLNHGIRGMEAVADEEFVCGLASSSELPYISESIDVKGIAESEKRNVEEVAREKRYEFLRRTAAAIGAGKIAVGHTLNDQAETALFRFIRGTGIEGLGSIHPVVDGIVIRPLLECSRETILEYLTARHAVYREDSTNLDTHYSRNRLRRQVLPLLESTFNPQLIQTLAREAELARETWSFIDSHARSLLAEIRQQQGDALSLPLSDLKKLHPAMQKEVIRAAIREQFETLRNVGSIHILHILDLFGAQSGSRVQLPRGGMVSRQFNEILFSRTPSPEESGYIHELQIPGSCPVPEVHAEFAAGFGAAPDIQWMRDTRSHQAFFDPLALPGGPLEIRSRRCGDRYGGQGHRKVKKMLIDSKIPASARTALPMVVVGNIVVWIPGFRPARGFEAKPNTTRCIQIQMQKTP